MPISSRNAFSLVELLVVLAIIPLLMAIVLAVLRDATETARVVVCAGNLRVQSQAIYAIATERPAGRLPTCDWGNTIIGIIPGIGGYRGDQWGVHKDDLISYGYTRELGKCPGVTPDTGGDARWTFWAGWDAGTNNGNDYLYTGGASNHAAVLKPPGYGFPYGKYGGKYISLDILIDDRGIDRTPSSVIYIGDIAYNGFQSYYTWYYRMSGYVDPSNHRDDSAVTPRGTSIWPAQGRGANHVTADGAVAFVEYPVRFRTRGRRMAGSYMSDYYASYW